MKKQHLLKSMLLLCALVVGSGSVWADALTTAELAWPIPQLSEDFNSLSTTSQTAVSANADLSGFGIFNKLYNNNVANTYAIESNATFGSNVMSLTLGSGSPLIPYISGTTFSTVGAFSFRVLKTSKCYVGFYKQVESNAYAAANATVYIKCDNGSISIGSGSGMTSVGSYTSSTIIDITVIYNNTTSATTYGESISIGAKKAHVFVNGNCVMNSTKPKEFTIPGNALNHFRITPIATKGNKAVVDDIKIYDKVPAASVGGTITASGWNTFSSAYDLDLSTITGGTAYVATAASTGKVTLEPTTAKVPAGTGLMIKGDATDDFTISTTTAATSTPAVNKLVGLPSGGKVEKNDNNYVFGWEDPSSPGFYLINSTEPTLAAGKAYLHTDAALSQFLSVDFEEGGATSIEAIESHKAQTSSAYFNLAGQRVAQPTKGLYIVNGKKVIIK